MLLTVSAFAALTAATLMAGDPETQPDGKGGTIFFNSHGTVQMDVQNQAGTGIAYHGGPVMLGTTNVYLIYYGNWSASAKLIRAQALLENWAQHIGGTPYFNIAATYFDEAGTTKNFVSNSVHLAGIFTVGTPLGTTLTDAKVKEVVTSINPTDVNGLYYVLTSPEILENSGFCTIFCGWHNHGKINNLDIKYSFIGDPAQCPESCGAQTKTPNGNFDADSMVNIMSHELNEAVSDPDLNAWFDSSGNEDGDKCNFFFGPTQTAPNGSQFNQTFGGRNWLIQEMWINSGKGGCRQHNP